MAMAKVTGASEAIRIDSDEGGRNPQGGPAKDLKERRSSGGERPQANGTDGALSAPAVPECPVAEGSAPPSEGTTGNRGGSSQSSFANGSGSHGHKQSNYRHRGGSNSSSNSHHSHHHNHSSSSSSSRHNSSSTRSSGSTHQHRTILPGEALARIMPHLQAPDPPRSFPVSPSPSPSASEPSRNQPQSLLPAGLANLPLDMGWESPVALARPGYLSACASPTSQRLNRSLEAAGGAAAAAGGGAAGGGGQGSNSGAAFGSPTTVPRHSASEPAPLSSLPLSPPPALSLGEVELPPEVAKGVLAHQARAQREGEAAPGNQKQEQQQTEKQQQQSTKRTRQQPRRRWSADLDCSDEGSSGPPSSLDAVADPSPPPGMIRSLSEAQDAAAPSPNRSAAAAAATAAPPPSSQQQRQSQGHQKQQQHNKQQRQQQQKEQEKGKAESKKAVAEAETSKGEQQQQQGSGSGASSPPAAAGGSPGRRSVGSEEESEKAGAGESSIPVAKHLATDLERLLVQVIPMIGLGEQGYTAPRKISALTMDTVWEWFDELSCYGREVYTLGGARGPSISYYVPFLSAIRLFSPVYKETPAASDAAGEIFTCDAQNLPPGFPVKMRLVYQFIETSAPKDRPPLCSKVESLFEGEGLETEGPSAAGGWDPSLVRNMRFQDIHPHSWFAVSWYPIYRIPDAPLKAAFLTYHTLSPIAVLLQPLHQQKLRGGSGAGGSLGNPVAAPSSPAPAAPSTTSTSNSSSSGSSKQPAASPSSPKPSRAASPQKKQQQQQPGSEPPAPGSPSETPSAPAPNPSLLLSLPVVGLEWYAMGDEAWCETRSAAKDTSPGTRLAESAWKAYISELRGTAGRLARSLGARGGRTLHHDYNFFNLRN